MANPETTRTFSESVLELCSSAVKSGTDPRPRELAKHLRDTVRRVGVP